MTSMIFFRTMLLACFVAGPLLASSDAFFPQSHEVEDVRTDKSVDV